MSPFIMLTLIYLYEISRLKLRMPWLYFAKCTNMTIIANLPENLIYYSSFRFCFRNNFIGVKAYSITEIEIMRIRVIKNDSVSFEVTQNPYFFEWIRFDCLKNKESLNFYYILLKTQPLRQRFVWYQCKFKTCNFN